MKMEVFNNTQFEQDSLAMFEKMLQGFSNAKQQLTDDAEIEELSDKLTHLATDPFSCRLMELFRYNYLTLSEDIGSVIEKALLIRE